MQSAPFSLHDDAEVHPVGRFKRQPAKQRIIACIGAVKNAAHIMPLGVITAGALDAELTLLHVIAADDLISAPRDPIASELTRREATMELSNLAEKWKGKVDNIKTVVLEGRAADQICIWAKDHKVDLTVICAGNEDATCRWALGDTAQRVIECIPGSVLVAPNDESKIANSALKKILVFLDGSCRAESALPLALKIAKSENAGLNLIHAVPEPELTEIGAPKAEDTLLRETISSRNEKVARAYFDQLKGRFSNSGVEVETTILKGGDARHMLLRAIDVAQADLVVLSSHGYSNHADVAAGSVASHLITHTPVPLSLVRDARLPSFAQNSIAARGVRRRNPFRNAV